MLVLARHEEERVFIGSDIVITVVKIKGGMVRLGIDAPEHVPIIREELRESRPTERPRKSGDSTSDRGGCDSTDGATDQET